MAANREYKDSVFTLLFKEPDKLRELYGALEGVTLPEDIPIEVNTLTDALFKNQINDISFTVDNRLVILIEHQSTINPNMPLRVLLYVAAVYEKIVDRRTLYKSKQVKIPVPEFVVLYNGKEPYKDTDVLRLSDSFLGADDLKAFNANKPALDLTVQVYNINKGKNPEMVRKSETLSAYSFFIDKVREFEQNSPKAEQEAAIKKAIKYCIDHSILADFLQKNASEVCNMLITEWNWDEYLEVQKEEAREDTQEEIAKNALAEGASLDFVQKITRLGMDAIKRIAGQQ
jgi:predicted transposase/invertase (TIGR01784 family)